MTRITYYNGEFGDFRDIKIPLTDRSIFFGDAIYDAAVGKDGNIYLEDRHIERFFSNAKKLNIPINISKSELSRLLHEVADKSGFAEYFIYFQLSRFSEERIHSYTECNKSNLLITVKEHKTKPIYETVRLISEEDIRYGMCDIKTVNLLPAVLASKRAETAGCDECVFYKGNTVTECAHSNIFIVKDGEVFTHPLTNRILPGITRGRVLEFCRELDIPCYEEEFSLSDMLSSDEVLISSTSKLLRRVSEIDGKTLKSSSICTGCILIEKIFCDYNQCAKKDL